jgi:hypothetical protein
MLKKPASFVLGSSKSSTYPRGYASGFDSPAASLDELFEHPARTLSCYFVRRIFNILACPNNFSTVYYG